MPSIGLAPRASRIACASGFAGGTGPLPAAATAIAVPAAINAIAPAIDANRVRGELVRRNFMTNPPFSGTSKIGHNLEITLTAFRGDLRSLETLPDKVAPAMRLIGCTAIACAL